MGYTIATLRNLLKNYSFTGEICCALLQKPHQNSVLQRQSIGRLGWICKGGLWIDSDTIYLHNIPQWHSPMGEPMNKYCFNQPFDVVERMADTCQARNSKTKAFKSA